MGRYILVGLLAFAVALAGTAYAEVQNIKVSGDIDVKAVVHNNYDLKNKQLNLPLGGQDNVTDDDDVNFVLSTVRVRVDADLTDNVSTTVRLLNQRIWGNPAPSDDDFRVHIDNAYVTLKEFLYSPLTVIVGRQDLKYGTGFIVGPGLLADPEGIFAALDTGNTGGFGVHGQIGQEYSAVNAYDAIRVILDFAPLTVEGVWAKISETGVADNDQDLYGALVNYKLDQWKAEIEPYWFWKRDQRAAVSAIVGGTPVVLGFNAHDDPGRAYDLNSVHTVGLRLAGSPIENLTVSGEGAFQFGTIEDTIAPLSGGGSGVSPRERDRRAWAANVDLQYTWAHAPWTPVTGIGWVFYSGEKAGGTSDADTFNAWDPMFRGRFFTFIQEFLGGTDAVNLYTTTDPNDTAANTNRHLLYGTLALKPLEDVTFWAQYTHAWFDKRPVAGRGSSAGDELDVKLMYDYTEDVQLGLFGGWFIPGSYYSGERNTDLRSDDMAWTLGASGSVKF